MTAPAAALQTKVAAPVPQAWSPAKRIAFRFAFSFFSLVLLDIPETLAGRIASAWGKLYAAVVDDPSLWLVRHWLGPHVLHIQPISGGPSSPLWYMRWLVFIVAAAFVAVIWSALDRQRTEYRTLHAWLCMFLRVFLGSILLGFGLAKIFRDQMQLTPSRLIQSFGSASPMGLLWTFMGGSPLYQVFTGIVETIAGIALFVPRLETLGALTATIAMTTVLVLDIGYNVQVKTNAALDLAVALFLLLPNMADLAGFVVFNRPAMPWKPAPLSSRKVVVVACIAAQLVWGAVVFGTDFQRLDSIHQQYVHAPETTPFYGIWAVEEFSQDGISRSLSIDDNARWTRFAFDNPGAAGIQWSDGSVTHVSMNLDSVKRSIALSRNLDDPAWKAQLTYESPGPDVLILHGMVKGHSVSAKLRHSDTHFRLTSEGIRWVQYGPDNR